MGLLILDVDGVMTDGTKTYNNHGEVVSKKFADHDFTAIKKFQAYGWTVCWLSADRTVNAAVAHDRKIDFHYSRDSDGTIDKVRWLAQLKNIYGGIDGKDVVYVGDDLFDLPIMKAVLAEGGQAFCPHNAAQPVCRFLAHYYQKALGDDYIAHHWLGSDGGHGCIMDLFCAIYPDDDGTPPRH